MNLQDIIIELKKYNDFNNLDELYNLFNNYNSFDYKHLINFSSINYNKNYLYSCESFDLVLICWKKGQYTQIHDHPNFCCLVKVLEGELLEEEYLNLDCGLQLNELKILTNRMITNKKQKEILHKIMANEDTISLHLYVPGNYKPNYYFLGNK